MTVTPASGNALENVGFQTIRLPAQAVDTIFLGGRKLKLDLVVSDALKDRTMRFPTLKHFRSVTRGRLAEAVINDADELVLLWGHAAFARADDLSWREDTGLMPSSKPGHWRSVRREIERRLGRCETEPMVEFAA